MILAWRDIVAWALLIVYKSMGGRNSIKRDSEKRSTLDRGICSMCNVFLEKNIAEYFTSSSGTIVSPEQARNGMHAARLWPALCSEQ